jgi:uncharacterized membrane protein YsdA (DUF1294 family)
MEIFVIFTRRPWYRKKKYAIPTSLLIILAVVGAILGVIMGLKAANHGNIGKIFDRFFKRQMIVHFERNRPYHSTCIYR